MNEPAGLGALFVSSFLAATLLPGGSEVVFSALLLSGSVSVGAALVVATLGNTLGGLSTYLIGRLVPDRKTDARMIAWLRRWGAPVLLLSWLPLIGDALCLAAGWLRVHVLSATLFIAAGKGVRYWILAQLLAS
ncbi:MAG: DedA family protein [Betaproteobacteria bacterium]|nr:MAG: DedA family protein [Betaproteobacteria bacterium]